MSQASLATLFDPVPEQWGLRGDPHLWEALSACFAAETDAISPTEFKRILLDRIKALAGENLLAGQDAFVERFDAGGTSGGHLSAAFWTETGIPLLLQRHQSSHRQVSQEQS